MSPRWRSSATARRAALAAALAVVAGCDGNGPTNPDGRGDPVALSFTIMLQAEQGGGEAAAFDKVTAMHIRLAPEGGAALFEDNLPFDPQSETRIPVSVLIQGETQATLDVTLLRNTDPLFRGTSSLTLVPNDVATADLTLVPVAGGISVPQSLAPLTSIGETRPLTGDVLFVTGDVAESLHLTWESLTPQVVSVQGSGATSSVVALAEGQGQLRASYGSFSSTVQVLVDVVAASVDVTPASSSIEVGSTVKLSFTAKDGLGHPITGTTATWSSDNEVVATVDQAGLVSGHRAGTATISATVEQVVGTATVEVTALPPEVATSPATGVGVYAATLHAQVNPNMTPTTAWFEWGTDPTLASSTETTHQDVGSGTTAQSVSETLEALEPSTTYYFRAVAENDGGIRTGSTDSFTTLALLPPTVEVLPPASVGSTSATLAGTVNPHGLPATAWFEWGQDRTMGKYTSSSPGDVGSGTNPVSLELPISGLTSDGAMYFYRVAADNGVSGTVRSGIESFQTAPTAPSGLSGGFDGPLYLSWTDNSASETYFRLERSGASGGYEVIGTSPQDYPYTQDSGPFPGPTAYYRVRACSPAGCSDPSNTFSVDTRPSIYGAVYVCYDSGTANCYGAYGASVSLTGPASGSYTTDEGGYFYFDYLAGAGTFTLTVSGVSCLRQSTKQVTVDWADYASVYFYADTACASPAPLTASNGFDPVIAGLLGIDAQPAARAAPAPR
jgi:hypothetical protein